MAESIDVLSQVLGVDGLRGEVFCRTSLGDSMSLSFPSNQAHFHVIERGPCWVSVAGEPNPVLANAGDLVLLLGGAGHSIASTADPDDDHPLWDVVPTHYDAERMTLDMSEGVDRVLMVCGRFRMDTVGAEAVADLLPPVVHLQGQHGALADWLPSMMRLLSAEATSRETGSALARARLVDLILVGAIRRWLSDHEDANAGWLGALRDPMVGPALRQLHAQPEERWTVERLAALVGLSRSPFAARFKTQVGVSPMKYLTTWRMRVAVRMIRQGAAIGEVATAVGYESEAAFRRVFKRETGDPPGHYRLQGRGPETTVA
ncbi:MAG: AraC family transcriptional regulator [Myxococcota bacterium]